MNAPYDDSLKRALSDLPVICPRAGHADRVRARCRTVIERRVPHDAPGVLEPATLSALCLAYAWQILRIVLP
jgi:hypothetical protein